MMSADPWAAIERVKAGKHDETDIHAIAAAIASGKLVIASAPGSVSISGGVSGSPIVTGNSNVMGERNIVIYGADAQAIQTVLAIAQEQENSSTPELSPEKLREAAISFLQDVENKFREARLLHVKQPIILKEQYVPIQVTLEPHKRDVETLRGYWETEEALKRAYALKGGEEELKRQQVDWQEAKQKHERIMVLADPGMGKSTLLRMEAGITVQEELQKLQNHQNPIVQTIFPLFLRLSELAKRSEELIDAIPQLMRRDYPRTAPAIASFLTEQLKAGKCLLLLDALDEVPKLERNRIELQEKLDRFVGNYPCSVICTSRIVGYDGNFLQGGQEVEIVPFREAQIEQYVTIWFTNAADHISDASVSAPALIRELRHKPQVRGLVQNPLLLSLICSLYQEKGLTLPARRVQVYEKAVEYMLEKWNQTRQSQFPGKTRAKIRLLEALAYHFSCEDQEVFDLDDLYDWMEDYLDRQASRDLRDAGTEALIVELSVEDGILQTLNPNADQYLFLHRTFQEYLAACYLARSEDGIELAKAHFWKYDWHETISLMAGLMKKPLPLLQTITDEKDDIFQTQLLLAGRCLAECEESSHPLMTEMMNRLYQFWLTYPDAEFIRAVVIAVGQTHSSLCEQLQNALNHENSDVRENATVVLEKIGSDNFIDGLISTLNHEDWYARWSAAEALGNIRSDKAIDALIIALNDENSDVRRSAAEALGKIGGDKAIDALITTLNDEEIYVRWSAAEALKIIGTDKAIDALITALNHKNSDVRWSAAGALGKIGSDKAIDALITALNHKDNNGEGIAETLGKIGSDKATDALITALNDKNSDVRWSAAEELGHIGSAKATDALITALNDKNSDVRWSTAEALGKIGSAKAIDALITTLNDNDGDVRWSAAVALGKIGSDKAIDALITALQDEGWDVRRDAANALGYIESDRAIDALITALQDEDSTTGMIAAEALGRIGSHRGIDALITALNDENSDVRWSAAEALGKIGSAKAIDALITALNDESNWSAAEALGKIGSAKAIDALITALNDENSDVRRSAAEELGDMGSAKAIDALITALNDEESDVKWSAAEALRKISHSSCLEKLIYSPQIDIYRSDIFSLARSLAVRYSKAGLPFIPVYPEKVAGIKDNRQTQI